MSDVKVPCGRMQGSHNPIDNETYAQMYCCKAKLCPNCTELIALRRRVEDWRSWVSGIIGFDHVATAKTDSHMRQDVKDEIQRLIDRVGEVEVAGERRVAELEATATRRLELLRPFADLSGDICGSPSDESLYCEGITFGDIRAAAAEVAREKIVEKGE